MAELEKVIHWIDGVAVETWEPPCTVDPCDKHRCCHCSCICMPDGPDNCNECAEMFEEER